MVIYSYFWTWLVGIGQNFRNSQVVWKDQVNDLLQISGEDFKQCFCFQLWTPSDFQSSTENWF